jgi:hypothetical protein
MSERTAVGWLPAPPTHVSVRAVIVGLLVAAAIVSAV